MGFVKADRYKQIRTIYLSDKEYKPISIVLDANIIKRIQDFFYSPHKMEVSKRLSIIDFLLKYRRFDLVAGAGLEELYNRDVKSVQRFEEIMNFLINCSKKEIMYHSESTVNPMLKPLPSNRKNYETTLEQVKSNPFNITTYAILLKSLILARKKTDLNKKHYIKLFEELASFVDSDLKMFDALAINVGKLLLLGTQEYMDNGVSKLLKPSSKKLSTVIGATWDLFYLRFIHLSQSIQFSREIERLKSPIIVTADKGFSELASLFSLRGEIRIQGKSLGILEIDNSKIDEKKVDISKVIEIEERLQQNVRVRNITNNNPIDLDQWDNLIKNLELEFTELLIYKG